MRICPEFTGASTATEEAGTQPHMVPAGFQRVLGITAGVLDGDTSKEEPRVREGDGDRVVGAYGPGALAENWGEG